MQISFEDQGCARFPENFSERQILWSLCSVDFHTLTLQLSIETPHFVEPELQVFVSSLENCPNLTKTSTSQNCWWFQLEDLLQPRLRLADPGLQNCQWLETQMNRKLQTPGTDPGFPVGGGADPLAGTPTYNFVKCSEKLHEIEKILGHGGGGRQGCPPKSATGHHFNFNFLKMYSFEIYLQKIPERKFQNFISINTCKITAN